MKTTNSTLTLIHLRYALQYWEDINLSAELNFQNYLKVGDISAEKINTPIAGSELSESSGLARSIKDYSLLRRYLENGDDFDPLQFLPRIPKGHKDVIFTQKDLVELMNVEKILLFPLFLSNWLKTKKVCKISNSEKLEFIDPSVENYLSYLPYDNFLISFDLSFYSPQKDFAKDTANSKKFFYTNFFVSRNENILQTFAIPDIVKDLVLTDEQRAVLKEAKNLSSKIKPVKYAKILQKVVNLTREWHDEQAEFLAHRTDIITGELLKLNVSPGQYHWEPFKYMDRTRDFFHKEGKYFSDSELIKILEQNRSATTLTFVLNGIGKLLANYMTPEGITIYDLSDYESSILENKKIIENEDDSFEKQEWYEVALGNVTYITFEKSKAKGKGFVVHTGREMPPHWRRPHKRNFKNEAGEIIKTIEVKQTFVRKDLHDKGVPIHGSKTTFK